MTIIKKLFAYYLCMISIFFIGRLGLFMVYYERLTNSDKSIYLSFLYGLKMDTITACILLVIPTLLLCLNPKTSWDRGVNSFLKYFFLGAFSLIIFMEIATFAFFAEYDVRPNYLFVEYLEYPKEVFSMLLADFKLLLILFIFVMIIFCKIFLKVYKNGFLDCFESSFLKRLALLLPLVALLFIGIRSSFGHRPANISDAIYSSNRILNEVTKNSIYSVGYAVYSSKKHGQKDIAKRYGKMNIDEAVKIVQNTLDLHDTNEKFFLTRFVKSNFKQNQTKNIVIFIQESLGAQFVSSTGGEEGITPRLNALSNEGILFTDLYSNGTRSIRGLAGLSAGNFSVPGKGVLKRNKSQSGFWTIASLLKPLGYKSLFIYGGESRFDNMKSWFSGNGFDIIDQANFENPKFVGTWGVCDEEVVIKANAEFENLYKSGQKFAAVMFSTSNHAPFDFPEGKIDLIEGVEPKSVKNAIKYADFAIGEFIDMARKSKYYKDTIFAVVADHNVRVYGDDIVPVNMFQIPGLILGEGIKAFKYDKIATQPDFLATMLDLAGIEANMPVMGHSIFSDKKKNLSLMQFNDRYALRIDDKIAVLVPNVAPKTFLYKNKRLVETSSDKELEKKALAFIIVLNEIYQKRLYK